MRVVTQIALTALLAMVVGLGVLGSERLASSCMRLSLVDAPCCAAMRAPVRLQGENSCCHGGRLDTAGDATSSTTHTEIAAAAWVAQPAWSNEWLAALSTAPQDTISLDQARPPPRAPHLGFTILRC